jgi:hypothetical protein
MPAAKKIPVDKPRDEMEKWLTRNQAVLLMNISHTTLINLENADLLHPGRMRGPNGREVIVYDPDELVKAVPRKRLGITAYDPGERCAQAFEHFERGASINEVVVKMREEFKRVRDWRTDWLDGGACDRVIGEEARSVLAEIVGDFDSVSDFIERVRSIVKKAQP